MVKLAAEMQAGNMPKIGARVDGSRAEYTYMPLKDLIAAAYKVKAYQVTGPDWLANQRFDIQAKLPDGASKDDVPQMLQALLEERFKMVAHRETKEHPVLALVVAKGGPKLQPSPEAVPIDEDAPLKPGEMKMDTPEGPVRLTANKDGSGTMNMGKKGTVSFRMDGNRTDLSSMSMHMEFSQVTMEGFAETLTQLSQQLNGGTGRQVKDMTELKGNYQVSLNIGLGDLIAMARAQGMDVPAGVGAPATPPGTVAASDPSGGATLFEAVAALGLKLEPSKAQVEQIVIDHVEKTPTEN
jgi:uncharacterized protein (TIGR03435 family)